MLGLNWVHHDFAYFRKSDTAWTPGRARRLARDGTVVAGRQIGGGDQAAAAQRVLRAGQLQRVSQERNRRNRRSPES